MHRILYTKEAKENIENLNNKQKKLFKRAIEKIAQNPSLGKRLTQELKGMQSYRAGDYRIIYRLYHRQILILILAIGHRKDIYRKIIR